MRNTEVSQDIKSMNIKKELKRRVPGLATDKTVVAKDGYIQWCPACMEAKLKLPNEEAMTHRHGDLYVRFLVAEFRHPKAIQVQYGPRRWDGAEESKWRGITEEEWKKIMEAAKAGR